METFSGLTPQCILWSILKTHDCPERARNTLVAENCVCVRCKEDGVGMCNVSNVLFIHQHRLMLSYNMCLVGSFLDNILHTGF